MGHNWMESLGFSAVHSRLWGRQLCLFATDFLPPSFSYVKWVVYK